MAIQAMDNRPHIEFIHAQLLPWRRIGVGAARPDAEFKFLSRDEKTGANTSLIRYAPGWSKTGSEHLRADEEFYVLSGDLEINGTHHSFDSYGYLPAGYTRKSMSTKTGAVVLTFFSAEPTIYPGEGDMQGKEAIERIDVLHMPWDMSLNDPKLAHLGISRKDLRLDPETGERTFLSMVLPHSEPPGLKGPQESHPVVEESYLVSGSLTGPQGTMEPGAYFWRPPGIAHGPFGTRWGAVSLMRFVGGKHVNVWSKTEAPFAFDAPYKPVLPDDLAPFAFAPWTPPPRY